MQQRGKRMAALALAAALCLTVPAAGANAEPWTYEVDSEMSGYGVEYYSDVGFDAPTRRADTTQSTTAGQDTTARTDAGISTYSAAGEGVAVYSADAAQTVDDGTAQSAGHEISVYSADGFNVYTAGANNTYGGDDYDYQVTIPAEVEVDTSTNKGHLSISGTLDKCCNLVVAISSQNGNQLKCEDGEESLSYKMSDSKIVFSKEATNDDKTLNEYTVDFQVLDTPKTSGMYTDLLTFDLQATEYTDESKRYTLTFDTNAENATEDDQVTISTMTKLVTAGETYGTLPTPKRDFYDFAGWYTQKTGGTQVTDATVAAAADTTVYAHWTGHKLTILYHNDGAEYIDWGSDPAGSNRAYTGADQATYEYKKTDAGRGPYVIFDEVSKQKDTITLMEVETYGQRFTNGVNGLFNVSRWYKSGYRLNVAPAGTQPSGSLWKIGKYGTRTCGQDDMQNWTVKDCAEALGVCEELKQGDVTVDLYPDWYQTGKTTTTSDAELWDDEPVILLPDTDTTTPVVTQPTDDTAADDDTTADADDTQDKAATPTRDLSTPVVVDLPADDTADAADAAQDDTGTAADTTPEELMLQDTDELLASFHQSDPDELTE